MITGMCYGVAIINDDIFAIINTDISFDL